MRLTLAEIGVLSYMQDDVDSEGHFQQHPSTIANGFVGERGPHAGLSTTYKIRKALIDKGAVTIIKPSGRNRPAVLRPITRTTLWTIFNPPLQGDRQ
jgi:hypothetical protein